MKYKGLLQLGASLTILIVAVFLFPTKSFAYYSQPLTDGYTTPTTTPIGMLFWGDPAIGNLISGMGTFTGITSITLTVKNTYLSSQDSTVYWDFYNSNLVDLCSGSAGVSIPVGISNVSVTLPCTTVTNVTLAGGYFRVYLSGGSSPIDLTLANYSADIFGSGYWNYIDPIYPAPPTLRFAINTSLPTPNSYDINFHAPDFVNNVTSADFRAWEADITAPINTVDGFNVKYKYASSTTWQFQDSVNFGHLNTNVGSYICGATICPPGALLGQMIPFSKSVNLPSGGSYQAYLSLMNGSTVLATSSILNFGVATGTPILHPGTESQPNGGLPPGQLWDSSWCPDTSFSVVGADFGKGFCVVFAFLFVPGQDSINNWVGVNGLLSSKPPFTYFYQLSNEIGNLSPSSSPMTGLTLRVGSSSTPIHLNVDMFSSSTIDRFTDNNSRGVVRKLIEWSLYLAFVAMVILVARNLFRGGSK